MHFPSSSPLRILVLAGGPSAEREISLQSGAAVAAALETRGHRVTRFDPRQEALTGVESTAFDVVFVALHGRYGEDGTVQRQLESQGLPYTGSSPEASALAFCKSAAKRRFRDAGVPTPMGIEFTCQESIDSILSRIFSTTSAFTAADGRILTNSATFATLVVKPDCQGSSIGVGFASSIDQLRTAIEESLRHDDAGLIEMAIPGEEWTVPFLDDEALPPIRIGTSHHFFDYEAKYLSDETVYEFPADSPLKSQVIEIARKAVQSLDVTGLSRVDLRVDPTGQPWVLEVNTIPGLTDHSLSPKAAAYAGIPFAEFCELTCLRAITSHQRHRQNRSLEPDSPTIRRAG